MVETLSAGSDFESSWISDVSFDSRDRGTWGILNITMNGRKYRYAVTKDVWETLGRRLAATRHEADSAGRAYNQEVKNTKLTEEEVKNVISMGRLEDKE